jgi:hypothetical protein
MNIYILALYLISGASESIRAEQVATAPSGSFSIHQIHDGEWSETIVFSGSKLTTRLSGFPWPGHYSISPDEHWILRTQKIGSGDNRAILYQIEKNGRVLEVTGFDEMLWNESDKVAKLKRNEMYHTGVDEVRWTDGKLIFALSGSNSKKSEDGIRGSWTYDLRTHSFTPQTEQGGGGNSAALRASP